MSKADTPLAKLADIPAALGLLSRLPVNVGGKRGAACAWAFPVTGLILGTIAAAIGWIAMTIGLSNGLTAGLALTSLVVMTGAMHEDGLADSTDGLWGGWDQTRRLEIMKDSHIGAYGVIALVLSLLLRWTALTALAQTGLLTIALIAVATLSRVPMVVVMAMIPHARKDGLSASVGRADMNTALIAVVIGTIVSVAFLGWPGITMIIAVAMASLAVTAIAMRKIGGQTGDILGATQQISEIVGLMVLTTAIS